MIETTQTWKIGDCVELMQELDDESIDLVVTSPPYDNLRTYGGYNFDFEKTANQLYRVIKDGGTIVWIVNDETIDGDESGTSFRQALCFKEIGFKLNDTMIWNKGGFTAVGALPYRYGQVFEYMFILTKGYAKTFNPIKDRPNKQYGRKQHGTIRQRDGTTKQMSSNGRNITPFGQRFNIWNIYPENSSKNRTSHPAQFSEELVHDHIISWSNEGDLVLDPFVGSGTTLKVCRLTNRNGIGFEINPEYEPIIRERCMADTPPLQSYFGDVD